MCKERTYAAARAVYWAASAGSAAAEAAWSASEAADAALKVPAASAASERYAQEAIDTLKREVKPCA
jgi:hypothetical protein